MKSGLAFFEWERPANPDTFRWAMRGEEGKRTWALVAKPGAKFVRYCPLDRGSALSEDFLLAMPNTDELLNLANRYGRLERRGMDSFDTWCDTVKKLRDIQEIFGGGKVVKWDRGRVTVGGQPLHKDLCEQWGMAEPEEGDDQDARELFVRQIINRELFLHVQAQVVPVAPHDPWGDRRAWVGEGVRVVPENLLGAIWLHLAMYYCFETRMEWCLCCGNQFKVEEGDRKERVDRRFCGVTCRSRYSRERKRHALRMADEGATAADIAAAVGSDVKTVKGWIKTSKKKEK